ncbi:sugar-binding domain-containing protein [Paenibacillus tengchongensis]|uniref:sugar-binding domain-containing protein n=1 Tax=Paenibacillus tengchongensis TaxID=2608684 RepID=UPI00124C719D|nr:sugar-binding domain-containing protein [Paenibacillus tengchongensis]
MSIKRKINTGWHFTKQPLHTQPAEVEALAGETWLPVSLPHDWLIYNTSNLYEDGEGWYRKTLTLPELPAQRRYALRFEGVYMNSTLYVNGQTAGEWKYGYSTFEFDITPYLQEGDNLIVMRVIHESPNSRWYSGAGIYRSVWLKSYPDTHLAPDGIYISARPAGGDVWTVEVESELVTGGAVPASLKLRHSILDGAGVVVTSVEEAVPASDPQREPAAVVCSRLSVSAPQLWDIAAPALYSLRTELITGEAVIEEESQDFGFRTFELDSERGFFLNGRQLKLQGVCQHHDLGSLGAAVNKAALRRQLQLLQEMGVNAVRSAHNMPAVELMELADELGILIVSEAFDMWERPKTPYDYARFFPEWWKRDIASWVRRDRNRPSLLMWSIGNEIYDTHADARGQEITRELMEEVLLHDPRVNAFVTIGSNFMPWENARKCADIVKVAGYNYGEKYYEQHHREHPDWFIYGSETCSTVQSRGVYHFPLAQPILADDDEQCSSLGNSSTSWGARSTEACVISDRDATFSLGQFLWTGFDYIGEPTPYHTKNSYFGQIDTAGFPKDSFYVYQAEWTDYRSHPMIHIFPYWDFSEGQLIDVRVTSNAPRIELFLNGESQGSFDIDHARGKQLVGNWQLPYTPGVLRAVAYDGEGRIIATDEQTSFGDAAALILTPDKTTLAADGSDLIFVTVTAADAEGRIVQNANNRVRFTVEGPGRLIGLDNGDSTDYDAYKGVSRRMFSGKLLAVIAATRDAGPVNVRAVSPGLTAGELTLQAVLPDSKEPDHEDGHLYADCPLEAYAAPDAASASAELDIPVRKLEIICPEGNHITPERPFVPVRVKLHPENATFREVEWRITNAAGIDANSAAIQVNGEEAVISALGDGDVYIRCGTANGGDGGVRLYAQMEFKLTGFGQPFLNPYELVSGGYHSAASRNLTNGNERGAATARDGESLIHFERIDFGDYGADELVLPVFSLDSEEFPIEIWEGLPGEPGAELVAEVRYQKPTQWNVYQEETYRLPRRLRGVTSLTFLLRRKIHLKGFRFLPKLKAFERLSALENSRIYGDSFTVRENAIEGIGNNVSLVYEGMDFGESGATRLTICGRSALEHNTLHFLFSGEDGDSKQLIEFAGAEGYTERKFVLEPPVTGKQTVTVLFLPGSRFDLQWFQFS